MAARKRSSENLDEEDALWPDACSRQHLVANKTPSYKIVSLRPKVAQDRLDSTPSSSVQYMHASVNQNNSVKNSAPENGSISSQLNREGNTFALVDGYTGLLCTTPFKVKPYVFCLFYIIVLTLIIFFYF